MPVYEYCCNSCKIQFELRQKFSDPPADKCPKCGGFVRKLVSAVSFSLKGAGWYGDGYGAKAEATKSEGDTAAGTVAGASEATATAEVVSTDATPAGTTVSHEAQASASTNEMPNKGASAKCPELS